MASITVRNLPDEVHRCLKQLAAQNNRSTEAEVRNILSTVVRQRTGGGLGTTLHKLWGNNLGGDLKTQRSTEGLREVNFE
ncbi:FitA-like ribbon-helix-helix domain-containing protein [Algirhabdus cladophorae]|uniref:FitA-like ribbon-helix-helix domain-containing protein n=1 Tax=Algirhabdus cladophorae TaxID=3377108 RepID=UPI003B84677D